MFCCSIGKTRQMPRPRMTGQEGHDKACAGTRTQKGVENKLRYWNYVLEPADVDTVYNKVKSAFDNHLK